MTPRGSRKNGPIKVESHMYRVSNVLQHSFSKRYIIKMPKSTQGYYQECNIKPLVLTSSKIQVEEVCIAHSTTQIRSKCASVQTIMNSQKFGLLVILCFLVIGQSQCVPNCGLQYPEGVCKLHYSIGAPCRQCLPLTLMTLLRIPYLSRIGSTSFVLPIRQNTVFLMESSEQCRPALTRLISFDSIQITTLTACIT